MWVALSNVNLVVTGLGALSSLVRKDAKKDLPAVRNDSLTNFVEKLRE